MRTRLAAIVWFAAGIVAMTALGAYGASISGGERGSFVMQFPAEGMERGGASLRQLTGEITVSVNRQGWLKSALQPNVVQIASHTIRNIGDTPRSIRFEAEGFPADVEWACRDLSWDPDTRTVRRAIPPNGSVDLDLEVTFPRPLPAKQTLMFGHIVILDAVSGEEISRLLVRVVNDDITAPVSGDCCE